MVQVRECSLFAGLDPAVVAQIESLASECSYDAQETIYREGDTATVLHVLAEGEVELSFSVPGHTEVLVPITRVQPGDVFSFSALVTGRRLTARAKSITNSRAYAIPSRELDQILTANPRDGLEIMRRLAVVMSTRLGDTRSQLRWTQSYIF